MGRRGPPPNTTQFRVLCGNPGNRPMNTREPQPKKATPRCPRWLSPEAKKAWKWLAGEMERMGILTTADRDAMVSYCQTFARWKAAEQFLAKHGDVYPLRDEQGNVKYMQQFPQVAIARSLLQLLKVYHQELGLTPASRTRIQVPLAETPPTTGKIVRDRLGRPI